jgi:transcriptional regulator with GAF, ATPase, and Fis domain
MSIRVSPKASSPSPPDLISVYTRPCGRLQPLPKCYRGPANCPAGHRRCQKQLQSVLKQALLRAHGPILLADFLPELPEAPGEPAAPGTSTGEGLDPEAFLRERLGPDARDLYAEAHRELDRLVLPRVLEYTGANQARAAVLLGIARRTLRVKLQDLGLHVAHSLEADADDLP